MNYTVERNRNGRVVALSWSAAIQEKLDAEQRRREIERARFMAPMASYHEWAKARGLPVGPDL